jgi:hypothetical protein
MIIQIKANMVYIDEFNVSFVDYQPYSWIFKGQEETFYALT